jgi:putative ABC transport system permease protein
MIALRLIAAAWSDRPVTAALHVIAMAAGGAVATALLLFTAQTERRFERDARGIDLVIGAKGSPLQLVLAAVFQADVPTGNIALADVERIAADQRVARAAPIGLGDSVRGFRIVGANADFLALHDARLSEGRLPAAPMQAIVGAVAARRLGLKIGDTFHGSHGLGEGGEKHEADYVVVGLLAPAGSVVDRLIVTPLASVWLVHGKAAVGAREATALLVRARTPFAAMALKREINAGTSMIAARPPEEAARLFALVGAGAAAMQGFAILLMGIAALSVFVSLTTALRERRGDIALLRAMGATRGTVFVALLGQGLATAAAGAVLGVGIGHGATEAFALVLPQARDLGLTGRVVDPREVWIGLAAVAAGLAAALIPAFGAYRIDVADALSEAP